MLKFDLQYFSEEEVTEEVEEVVEDTPIENEEPTETEEPDYSEANKEFLSRFKIPFNKDKNGEQEFKSFESIEELMEAAQSGSALPKYKQKATEYEEKLNNPLYKWADEWMKTQGFEDGSEFVKAIKVNEKMNEYINNGMSEDAARQAAEDYVGKTYGNQTDAKSKAINGFLDWHQSKVEKGVFDSNIDPDNLPDVVVEAYKNGESLKEAYQDYMLEQIKFKTEQDTLKKVSKNKETSTGDIAKKSAKANQDMSIAQVNKLLDGMSENEQSEWADSNWEMLERIKYFG